VLTLAYEGIVRTMKTKALPSKLLSYLRDVVNDRSSNVRPHPAGSGAHCTIATVADYRRWRMLGLTATLATAIATAPAFATTTAAITSATAVINCPRLLHYNIAFIVIDVAGSL